MTRYFARLLVRPIRVTVPEHGSVREERKMEVIVSRLLCAEKSLYEQVFMGGFTVNRLPEWGLPENDLEMCMMRDMARAMIGIDPLVPIDFHMIKDEGVTYWKAEVDFTD